MPLPNKRTVVYNGRNPNVEAALNYNVFGYDQASYRLRNVFIRIKTSEQVFKRSVKEDMLMTTAIDVKKRMRQGFEAFLADEGIPAMTGIRDRTCMVVRDLEGFQRMTEKFGWPTLISIRSMPLSEVTRIATWMRDHASEHALAMMAPDKVVSDYGNPNSAHVVTFSSLLVRDEA